MSGARSSRSRRRARNAGRLARPPRARAEPGRDRTGEPQMMEQQTHERAGERRGNAAEAFVATLHANGIDTIFGLPGSTEAPLLEALRADGRIRYVLTLQESATVAMADGYARAS